MMDETSPDDGKTSTNWTIASVALLSFGWLVAYAWWIDRVLGFNNLPQMLPHEIGAIIAGATAPLAMLWALAAILHVWGRNAWAMGMLTDESGELAVPLAGAVKRVPELNAELLGQAERLERTAKDTFSRMDTASASFSQQADNLSRSAEEAVERVSQGGEALRAQAESLATTVNRMTSRLDAMRQISEDQTRAIEDAASETDSRTNAYVKLLLERGLNSF